MLLASIDLALEVYKTSLLTIRLQKQSLVGLEPTTFRLEVGCAIQLRHRDNLKY